MNCIFCSKESKNSRSKLQHEIRCKLNPEAIKVSPSYGMLGKKGANQFSAARRCGKDVPRVSDETKAKILRSKASNGTLKHTDSGKRNISHAMKLAVEKYPESYTSANRGRTKQIVVDGIKLQGQWEVDFYMWAKNNGLNPKRPQDSFEYSWNGIRRYHPDFYIEALDLYIEVKGYETERDRAKWNQFPKSLRVIKQKEIDEIRKGCFVGL